MNWLKDVILDIAVTVIIAIWVFTAPQWAYYVIAIYTPFMVVLKLMAISVGVSKAAAHKKDGAPVWFYHLIYALNLILLLVGKWWLVAGAWALIWILSAVHESRKKSAKPASRKNSKKRH